MDDAQLIQIKEKYGDNCLNDNTSKNISNERRPKGEVEIYDKDKKLLRKSNLVVYQGRETLIQRIFSVDNTYSDGGPDSRIAWFGLGSGGVSGSDPFDPSSPISSDTDLYSEIPISITDTTCGDLRVDGYYYKHPFESVIFEQDVSNDNAWLTAKITIQIGADDANDQQISEAGLFMADSSAAGYSPGADNFSIYSRVTFPTILKTSDRKLTFVWYLYF